MISLHCAAGFLFGGSTNNLQQEKEDLDYIDVDGECSEHVLLWTNGVLSVSNQQLSVICQEQSENYGSYSRIKHVKPKYVFEGQHDGCNDASHEHDDTEDTEKALALGEVDLRLEAEHCDGDADDSCDSQRKKHCFCVIVTGYGSSHIRQRQSKEAEQNHVPWELPPGALAADQHDVGDEIHCV